MNMKKINKSQLIDIAFIAATLVVVTICIIININATRRTPVDNLAENSSAPETIAEETINDITTTETTNIEPSVVVPEPSTPATLTFDSDDAIYNYAVSQINTKKYYSAIKYLRQIPDYKDSAALMENVYRNINQNYLAFDSWYERVISCKGMNETALASRQVYNRKDETISSKAIVVCTASYFIDETGTFYIRTESTTPPLYTALADYNKNVKFKKIIELDMGSTAVTYSGYILTLDNRIIRYTLDRYDNITYAYVSLDAMHAEEKPIDIQDNYVLTNLGNVYQCKEDYSTPGESKYYLQQDTSFQDIVSLHITPSVHLEDVSVSLGLTTNGTILGIYGKENYIPMLKSWSDIISVEYATHNTDSYCYGLTSDGTILATKSETYSTTTFTAPNSKYIAITCYGNKVYGLTESGDVHMHEVTS